MKVARFIDDRRAAWDELETLAAAARRRPQRLGPDGVRRLGALYRAAAADLALARRAFPGDPVVARLENLVARARQLVYAAPRRRVGLVEFFRSVYWRLVAERPFALAAAALLLFAPGALACAWALADPGAAGGLVPEEYRVVSEPRPEGADLGLSSGEKAAFSSEIFTNNLQVSLLAFAGGIAAGLITAGVLILNGVLLGTVTGLAWEAGNGRVFVELVTPHGLLELSCIVVTAAAGLRVGWALVEPGLRTRVEAVVTEARRAVAIVLGTAPWLVLAGLVEGFFTPSGPGLAPVLVVGFALALVYWVLVWVLAARAEPFREEELAP